MEMGDVSFTPRQMVVKKIDDITKQRDRLHEIICAYVNKAIMGSRSVVESTPEDNIVMFLNAFFKLDKVSEVLRNIDVTLQDAQLLFGACVEKNQSVSTQVQTENILQSFHRTQELLIKQEVKKNMDKVLLRLNNLEKDRGVMKQELAHSVDQHISQFSEGLNQANQTLDSKVEAVSLLLTDVSNTTHSLQSRLDSSCKQMNESANVNDKMMLDYIGHTNSEIRAMEEKRKETESKCEQLCLILATKVSHLEKVRDALNTAHANVQKRCKLEECCKKNEELIDVLVGHIDVMGLQTSRDAKLPVGFSAQLAGTQFIHGHKGTRLINFDYILCNKGGTFNGPLGTFTAVDSGLYCFGLSIHRASTTPCIISIVRQTDHCNIDILETDIQNETAYSVQTAVLLKASDVVFVQVRKAEQGVILLHSTTFSGWLIS